jgi:formate/nitrite transporter FocA (FNT family)
MFYLPAAYLLKLTGFAPAGMDVSTLTLHNIFIGNFLPVTLGNFVGGALFVGALYWILHGKSIKSS